MSTLTVPNSNKNEHCLKSYQKFFIKIYSLEQISHCLKCMGSSGDAEISSFCRYDISVVTKDKLMKFCSKSATLWKFTNFILTNMYFIRILRFLKNSRYFWTSPRTVPEIVRDTRENQRVSCKITYYKLLII